MYVNITKAEHKRNIDTGEWDLVQEDTYDKVFLAKVPIMLQSTFCSLHGQTDKELTELGECPYDQVGLWVDGLSSQACLQQIVWLLWRMDGACRQDNQPEHEYVFVHNRRSPAQPCCFKHCLLLHGKLFIPVRPSMLIWQRQLSHILCGFVSHVISGWLLHHQRQ